ncbi:hypothetical protein BDK51DRAFT_43803 [Blyttiomyces helicus]|uniref:Uncharacterized protein n=1 Tax=Blyttiomyces helicus TaxID=388810 RepID=A0A4P9WMY8_9FUNG|nr:hypothetical protein BDK51DRAFT_43803 [Blyttiomyces helicus]|eukprot:RKO94439.1 hypothetical protein BDK51DRAFT_43803 [Blyttiomyces helicus]
MANSNYRMKSFNDPITFSTFESKITLFLKRHKCFTRIIVAYTKEPASSADVQQHLIPIRNLFTPYEVWILLLASNKGTAHKGIFLLNKVYSAGELMDMHHARLPVMQLPLPDLIPSVVVSKTDLLWPLFISLHDLWTKLVCTIGTLTRNNYIAFTIAKVTKVIVGICASITRPTPTTPPVVNREGFAAVFNALELEVKAEVSKSPPGFEKRASAKQHTGAMKMMSRYKGNVNGIELSQSTCNSSGLPKAKSDNHSVQPYEGCPL